jgi:hypothetical protein
MTNLKQRRQAGDETQQRTAPLGEAVMFRDAEYGALVVETAPRGLVTFDFGFAREDAQAAHAVISRYATDETVGAETRWVVDPDAYGLAVLSTLKQEMRLRGYQSDKLAERAVVTVKPGEVRRPDLPAEGKVIVHEAVEAGIRQHLGLAVAALREGGQASAPSLRYYPRPNAEQRGAVRAPFAVARFFVETTKPAEKLREAALNALGDWREHLVKLSVVAEAAGRYAVEMGLAIPASLCESFLDAAIPTFEHSNILGAREVEYELTHALTEEERTDIEAFGRSCTGCVRIQQEGTRLVVQVPSNIPGHYGADNALHERLAWLNRVLEPWAPRLQDIGPLAEVDLTPNRSPEELAEYKKMTSQQRLATAKTRAKVISGPHKQELLQRQKDWKKNKGAQKKASVWRKRTAAMRGESVDECGEEGMAHEGDDDAANMVNGDVVATLATRFAKMPPAWWSTPQGEDALRKAKALIKDEHGEDAAEQFDKQLELLRLTSAPTMKAEAVDQNQMKMVTSNLARTYDRSGLPKKEVARKEVAKRLGVSENDPDVDKVMYAILKVMGYVEGREWGLTAPLTEASITVDVPGFGTIGAEKRGSEYAYWYQRDGGPRMVYTTAGGGIAKMAYQLRNSAQVPSSIANAAVRTLRQKLGESVDASLGRTMLKAAGTFVPAAGAKMDGSDDEEEKGVSEDPLKGDEDDGPAEDEDGDGEEDDEDDDDDKEAAEESTRPFVEDFAAYLGEPGRGNKKSQYSLVGRGTNMKMVSGKGRTNLHRLHPASLVTVETDGPEPLPFRVDGTRKELAKVVGGKIVDTEDNRFGGVESVAEGVKQETFVLTFKDGRSERVLGGFVVDAVWGLEKGEGGYILHHLPSNVRVRDFATKNDALAAIKRVGELPGTEFSKYTRPEQFPEAVKDAMQGIFDTYRKVRVGSGKREPTEKLPLSELVKRMVKDSGTTLEIALKELLNPWARAKSMSARTNLGYGSPPSSGYWAAKKEVDAILAAGPPKEGVLSNKAFMIVHPPLDFYGVNPGDDLRELDGLMKKMTKTLTVEYDAGKKKAKFAIKFANLRWGANPYGKGDAIRFDASYRAGDLG